MDSFGLIMQLKIGDGIIENENRVTKKKELQNFHILLASMKMKQICIWFGFCKHD
jgi:hypothetical protein